MKKWPSSCCSQRSAHKHRHIYIEFLRSFLFTRENLETYRDLIGGTHSGDIIENLHREYLHSPLQVHTHTDTHICDGSLSLLLASHITQVTRAYCRMCGPNIRCALGILVPLSLFLFLFLGKISFCSPSLWSATVNAICWKIWDD